MLCFLNVSCTIYEVHSCDFIFVDYAAHLVNVIMSYHQGKETALMKASHGGHVSCAQLLLDKGAKVDHEDVVSESHNILSVSVLKRV